MSEEFEDNPVNDWAWSGCIRWALEDKEIVAAFEKETGTRLLDNPRSGLEKMIDNATGFKGDGDNLRKRLDVFILWVTETIWGMEYAPKAYREVHMDRPIPCKSSQK